MTQPNVHNRMEMTDTPANTDEFYVVDVSGKRMVIVARHYPGSSAADVAELQGIVDSIQIQP